LLHCHSGCGVKDIVSALGLTMADLFDEASEKASRSIVKTYDYGAAQGSIAFQVVRTEPKGFYQRRPDGHGGWINNLKGVRRVLYRLPELAAAESGALIFVCEGEKDVDKLCALGLVATCNPGGAGKWGAEYNENLRDRPVIIIPDNDQAGSRHAQQVADSLSGIAASLKLVELPGVPEKGDVSDYLNAGHTKEELLRLVASAPVFRQASADGLLAHHTDLGNAERFARLHGRDVRHCHVWAKWLCWESQRWVFDDSGEVVRRAADTVRLIYEEASRQDDAGSRRATAEHARRSEAESRLRAMVALARSEPGIPVQPQDLDRDPWKLNVANGALDLMTGRLLQHSRDDLATKLAPVVYDRDAQCPLWEAFLDRIFDGDVDLIGFVRRVAGYTLTGSTKEHVFFMLFGTGANGKSTFLEVLRALLGDYARTADFSSFLHKARSGVSNDLARLAGARLVTAQEAEGDARLAEALVKQVTGGDAVQARFLYSEHFEFHPAFKLFLAANHKPAIRGTDCAIWRRTRMIPFAVTIPEAEQDKDLVNKLKDELSGILAWAVRGCLEWQRDGLGSASAVTATTKEYREESDILGTFLAECCVLENTRKAAASDIYAAYKSWADRNGEHPASQTSFGRQLGERGLTKKKSSGRSVWIGIGLSAGEGRDSLDGSSEKSPMREDKEKDAREPSNHPQTIPNDDTNGTSEQGRLGTVGRVRNEPAP
ncbi:MAG: phage/plasmid primase, P4 family, partial [Candidatus Bipolaricaulis sp.]|nr:phage/plasmid primase, P4 family [Candidatus Bipolaricaulis sp.]